MSTKALTKTAAQKLMNEIREGLLNIEQKLTEFINGKGWVALGYTSFIECWNDELSGVRLATDAMRGAVVYAMFDENQTNEQIIKNTGGRIGDEALKTARQNRGLGMPPHRAFTHVRTHERKLPTRPSGWNDRVNIDEDERAHFEEVLSAHGYSTVGTQTEWTTRVLRREIGKLERSGVRG